MRNIPVIAARVAAGIWLAALGAMQAANAVAPPADPFEPTVTRQEADAIGLALKRAESDLAGAMAGLAAQTGPQASAALDYTLGNLYSQTNRLDAAAAAYREAVRKFPRFRAAQNNLGRVAIMQDRPREAMDAFAALARDGQADAETMLLFGHAATLAEEPVTAESAYRHALLLRPGDGEARRGLARSLLQQERYAEASALVRELIAQDPAQPELWSLRTSVQLSGQEADAALTSLETARRLGAATSDMLATLGDLYLNRQQPRDAVDAYLAAFAATGGVSVARQLRAAEGLLSAGDVPGAERLLQQAEAREQANPAGSEPADGRKRLHLRAQAARLKGESGTARAAYRELVRRDPLDAEAILGLGDLDRDEGKPDDAVLNYERAARVAGFESQALVRQAEVEVERGRYGAAVALLESAQAFKAQPQVARYLEQVRRLVPRLPPP